MQLDDTTESAMWLHAHSSKLQPPIIHMPQLQHWCSLRLISTVRAVPAMPRGTGRKTPQIFQDGRKYNFFYKRMGAPARNHKLLLLGKAQL